MPAICPLSVETPLAYHYLSLPPPFCAARYKMLNRYSHGPPTNNLYISNLDLYLANTCVWDLRREQFATHRLNADCIWIVYILLADRTHEMNVLETARNKEKHYEMLLSPLKP